MKHFHFTAWPDHGVPQGTKALIQFRRIMRWHMEREGVGAPTVVHCRYTKEVLLLNREGNLGSSLGHFLGVLFYVSCEYEGHQGGIASGSVVGDLHR